MAPLAVLSVLLCAALPLPCSKAEKQLGQAQVPAPRNQGAMALLQPGFAQQCHLVLLSATLSSPAACCLSASHLPLLLPKALATLCTAKAAGGLGTLPAGSFTAQLLASPCAHRLRCKHSLSSLSHPPGAPSHARAWPGGAQQKGTSS